MPEDVPRFTVDAIAAFGGYLASTIVARVLAKRLGACTAISDLGSSLVVYLVSSKADSLEPYEEMISVGAAVASLSALFRRCAPAHITQLVAPPSIGDYSDAHEQPRSLRG